MNDKHKAEACPEIGFECGNCKAWNSGHSDYLDRGPDLDGQAVESDVIMCQHCGTDNLVYRII